LDTLWRESIWQQFGAAIDMLDNALLACPEELWNDRSQKQEFWYITYHCLFWLDLYLYGAVEGFAPPPPFTLDELDPAGVLPDRVYTKDELHIYLIHCRTKCQATVESLTDEKAHERCTFGQRTMSFAELLLYNMRHVQEHAAQLSLILGQKYNWASRWVGRATSQP
jgi:DinB superfamily